MKILMPLLNIQDLGGIINHAEHLIHGLKACGHEVTLVRLENKEELHKSSFSRELETGTHSGIPLDQKAGWAFPLENRVALKSVNWKQYASKYDLILWEIPMASKGYDDMYRKMFGTGIPQIAFVHDGNMEKMYPDLAKHAHKFEYLACVHPCALGNARAMGIDNARLIVNPQIIDNKRMVTPNFGGRKRMVTSFQTFKAWKRVDEFVRAVPLFKKGTVVLGGGGIEYHYMTSKDKRKPKYGKIWEKAIEHGMRYVGYVSEEERDGILRMSRLIVDSSWSKRYAKYGSHFNRVMIDGIIQGVVPVLRDLAMVDNGIFEAGKHYIEIPYDASPEEYACVINEAMTMKSSVADKMLRSSQRIVRRVFDSKVVAAELLR